ncbi:expressed unknown protein [Seminavis robusta]|uniref:Uncharacterized protein n=1 Tax=Seminavis robusta TaxID=568900 RepID=A0A9N8HMQ4_9STRA|nr:expressed unknown protein [Seminavis robusta]|eukprot:Sro919_g220150.1 n/a (293) ;mRNA; r:34326-35281
MTKTASSDDATYVTWAQCFHPENATVTFEGSPLWTVYEGAREDLPVAEAVPVTATEPAIHDLGRVEAQAPPPPPSAPLEPTAPTSAAVVPTTPPPPPPPVFTGTGTEPSPNVSNQSMGLDLIVGCILSWTTILIVASLELTGWLIYFCAAGCWKVTKCMEPPNVFTGLIYSIFGLVYWVLALVDSILLLVSVLVSELMAGICFLLSTMIGGCELAGRWHQYIRKTCHKARWAFRSKLICKDPPRIFCGISGGSKKQDEHETSSEGKGSALALPLGDPLDENAIVVYDETRRN